LSSCSLILTSTILTSTILTSTSPSIYANFHSISAADWCGPVGSEATITQTMLTFSAGELSTIAGPLHNPVGSSHQNFSTRMFDFADLPCPPQSVMVSLKDPEPLHNKLMRPHRSGRELVHASTRRTLSSASRSAEETHGHGSCV